MRCLVPSGNCSPLMTDPDGATTQRPRPVYRGRIALPDEPDLLVQWDVGGWVDLDHPQVDWHLFHDQLACYRDRRIALPPRHSRLVYLDQLVGMVRRAVSALILAMLAGCAPSQSTRATEPTESAPPTTTAVPGSRSSTVATPAVTDATTSPPTTTSTLSLPDIPELEASHTRLRAHRPRSTTVRDHLGRTTVTPVSRSPESGPGGEHRRSLRRALASPPILASAIWMWISISSTTYVPSTQPLGAAMQRVVAPPRDRVLVVEGSDRDESPRFAAALEALDTSKAVDVGEQNPEV